jgi:ribosomal protein S18 acetylase RimI-like enzyme
MSKEPDITVEEVSEVTDEIAQAVSRLVAQLSPDAPKPDWDRLCGIVDSKCTSLFLARDTDGRIIGMLILAVYTISTGLKVWIEDVVVDDKGRGKGVGRALCRRAIDEAGELGAKAIDLTSRPSREAANLLYQKLGFEKRDTNVYRLTLR